MSAGNASTRVARTVAEVESLRADWGRLQSDRIQADLDYFLTNLAADPASIRPHVVALERGGRVAALLVGRIARLPLPCKLGYRTVCAPEVRALGILPGGVLGAVSEEDATVLVDEVRAALRRHEAEVAVFRHLPVDSVMSRVAHERPSFVLRQRGAPRIRGWELELPPTYDAFLKALSRSTRDGYRRYANRFAREFGDRIRVEEYRSPADVDRCIAAVEAVAARSWQRGIGVGFVDDERHRALVELCLERGWLRVYLLYVDDEPIAFWMGEVYGGRFRSLIPGYDPAYRDHRVGNFLLLQMIERLCGDPGVRVLDFGLGDVEYKQRLAERTRWVGDVTIYGPTPRAVSLNLLRSLVHAANDSARRAARSLGLLERVKRGWRARASSPAPGGAPQSGAPERGSPGTVG